MSASFLEVWTCFAGYHCWLEQNDRGHLKLRAASFRPVKSKASILLFADGAWQEGVASSVLILLASESLQPTGSKTVSAHLKDAYPKSTFERCQIEV